MSQTSQNRCIHCHSTNELLELDCECIQCKTCTELCPKCNLVICLYCSKDNNYLCEYCYCCVTCCNCPELVTCDKCKSEVFIDSSVPEQYPINDKTRFVCETCMKNSKQLQSMRCTLELLQIQNSALSIASNLQTRNMGNAESSDRGGTNQCEKSYCGYTQEQFIDKVCISTDPNGCKQLLNICDKLSENKCATGTLDKEVREIVSHREDRVNPTRD